MCSCRAWCSSTGSNHTSWVELGDLYFVWRQSTEKRTTHAACQKMDIDPRESGLEAAGFVLQLIND